MHLKKFTETLGYKVLKPSAQDNDIINIGEVYIYSF